MLLFCNLGPIGNGQLAFTVQLLHVTELATFISVIYYNTTSQGSKQKAH